MRWLPLFLLAWFALAAGQPNGGIDLAGVRFDERARIGTTEGLLNGAGLRGILGFKFYVIAVYLPQRLRSTEEILRVSGAKRIQVVTMFDLNAELVAAGLAKGIRRNLSEAEFEALRPRVDLLRAAVRATREAPAGSLIQFDWLPAASGGGVTRLSVNTQQRGEDIPGEDFYQALLKVWLGDKVNDARLREALLGR